MVYLATMVICINQLSCKIGADNLDSYISNEDLYFINTKKETQRSISLYHNGYFDYTVREDLTLLTKVFGKWKKLDNNKINLIPLVDPKGDSIKINESYIDIGKSFLVKMERVDGKPIIGYTFKVLYNDSSVDFFGTDRKGTCTIDYTKQIKNIEFKSITEYASTKYEIKDSINCISIIMIPQKAHFNPKYEKDFFQNSQWKLKKNHKLLIGRSFDECRKYYRLSSN